MPINIRNEHIKREFYRWLKEGQGNCDSTLNSIEKAINLYEDFTNGKDFATFNPDKAIKFKEWLKAKEHKSKPITITTIHTYLRNLRKFFAWLMTQQGYKRKIHPDTVDYLNISTKEAMMATQSTPKNFPPLEYVVKLADSIKFDSEIGLRDRALISFTLLSGMRDKAVATLPLGCFNKETLAVIQNPKQGVQTKFSKYIPSTLMKFDERLVQYVVEWANHLTTKGFGSQDPLFPRSKVEKGQFGLSFEKATEVEPIFWQGTGRIREIFKRRAQEANLPYFPPHTFRHSAIALAIKACSNGEQMKAISQNFGHEHIATTLQHYANYDARNLSKILNTMDFTDGPETIGSEKLKRIKEILDS